MDRKEAEARQKILVFGGTSEGREFTGLLLAQGFSCTVCVATEYGAQCLARHPKLEVRIGRMDCAAMISMLSAESFSCVVDATHPHAAVVTGKIQNACTETGVPYLRYQRETGDVKADLMYADPRRPAAESDQTAVDSLHSSTASHSTSVSPLQAVYVNDMAEAAAFLRQAEGRILVTTGSKEIEQLSADLGDPSRLVARVLPAEASLQACARAGLRGGQIIAMQGPFDTEMNCALISHYDVSWLLTKESGKAGGLPEKMKAAAECGIGVVVIRSPERAADTGAALPAAGTAAILPATGTAEVGIEKDNKKDISSNIEKAENQTEKAAPFFTFRTLTEIMEKVRELTGTKENREIAGKENGRKHAEAENGSQQAGTEADSHQAGAEPGSQQAGLRNGRELALVGIGVGARKARTLEAQEALEGAQVIFGAPAVLRMLQEDPVFCERDQGTERTVLFGSKREHRTWIPEYDSRKILAYLEEHPEIRRAAVAYSGDSGFYSGAASMAALVRSGRNSNPADLGGRAGCSGAASMAVLDGNSDSGDFSGQQLPGLRLVCGVSSISWFAARAGIPWQDMKILSSHGRECNVVGQVRRHPKCFLLLSGVEDLRRTGALLEEAQNRGVLGELRLICGYSLSRPEEEIRECTAAQLREADREGLYVLYIEHRDAMDTPVVPGLPDSAFTRGKVPMTSAEIRALSLCRLRLTAQAVLYDVGAGTGSVSVEAALMCPEGTVYSIERSEKAVALLKENRDRFCLSNMRIIEGEAPEALDALPAPTHAFIGGSGGNLKEILRLLLRKNPTVRIVVNCITMETLMEIRAALEKLPVCDVEWTQVSAARGDTLGRYHYLRAQNPVFVISFTGRKGGI